MMRAAALLAVLVLAAVPVQAQVQASPGLITPAWGPLYQIEILIDNIMIALSPNPMAAKMAVMQERLAEYQMTKSQLALNDYLSKLESLEEDLARADPTTREIVKNQIREMVRNAGDDERIMSRVIEVEKNIEKIGACQVEVSAPSAVKVGETYTVSAKLCNCLNETIESVELDIYLVKSGIEGAIFKHHVKRTIDVEIAPGQCIEDEFNVTVPSTAFGIGVKGTWNVKVVVKAHPQGIVIGTVERTITVD